MKPTTTAQPKHRMSAVSQDSHASGRTVAIVCIILALITCAAFIRVLGSDFTNYDDPLYVTENPNVTNGISPESLHWAFNAGYASNWHPLTWISHMLDCQVFGLNPTWHHLTNLLLHILSAVLLLLILRRLTGSLWKSAFVAALFALHPLHVESVAWIAERKDVLSTLFWMLTMGAYLLYTERPSVGRYVAVVVLYALGLMAKPMLVTLPFVLLLLDWWPLGRRDTPRTRLIMEKVPLGLLAVGSSILTMIAQARAGSVAVLQLMPISWRIENALVSTVGYIGKMLLPIRLAVFYPHPEGTLAAWQIVGSALILTGITLAAVVLRRRHPYLITGWLWYLITLAPTVGIIQVGRQAMADRYTYMPLVGLFIAVTWGVAELNGRMGEREKGRSGLSRSPILPFALSPILCLTVVAACAVGTWVQASCWHDSQSLWEHALKVTRGNYTAHVSLGKYLADQQMYDEAIAHYREAIRIEPEYDLPHYNLGVALSKQGESDEAIREFRETLRINPHHEAAKINLSAELQAQGKLDEALEASAGAESAEMHFNNGVALDQQHRFSEAVEEYRKSIEMNPDFAGAQNNLAVSLFFNGDYAASWKQVHACRERGIELHPGFIAALSEKMPEPRE